MFHEVVECAVLTEGGCIGNGKAMEFPVQTSVGEEVCGIQLPETSDAQS